MPFNIIYDCKILSKVYFLSNLWQDLLSYGHPYNIHTLYKFHISGASKGPSPYDATHWIGPEGYLCPSHVDYAKIKRAVNVEGYWLSLIHI